MAEPVRAQRLSDEEGQRLQGEETVLAILPAGANRNRWKITVKGWLHVYVRGTCARELNGLRLPYGDRRFDGDLARLQQWPRREDGPVRAGRRAMVPGRRDERLGGPCLGGRRRGLPH